MADHVLLLMRHAKAEDYVPGARDDERPLSEKGLRQSAKVGDTVRRMHVDQVLCSPATRTRQTLEGLGLSCPVDYVPEIYNAGSDTILAQVVDVPEEVRTVLVVGHAPGVPALAQDLADPGTSDPAALSTLESGYPPATMTRLEFDGTWSDLSLGSAAVTAVIRP